MFTTPTTNPCTRSFKLLDFVEDIHTVPDALVLMLMAVRYSGRKL